MADNPWIEESDTGGWYINQVTEDGREVRKYADELNDYQQSYEEYQNANAYGQYVQEAPRASGAAPSYQEASTMPRSRLQHTARRRRNSRSMIRPRQNSLDTWHQLGGLQAPLEVDVESYSLPPEPHEPYEQHVYPEPSPLLVPAPQGPDRNIETYQIDEARTGRESPQPRVIASTGGEVEHLDSSYRARNTDYWKFFQCGRVFQTLWTDPYRHESGHESGNESENSQFMSTIHFEVAVDKHVFSKIRRFVVVSRYGHSCQCLPVTSYDGKGYRKLGVNLDQHGFISNVDERPDDIPEITRVPLRIKPSRHEGGSVANYLINYGRSYCVDTNVKVKDIGTLDGPSRRLLRKYYKEIHLDDSPSGMLDDKLPEVRGNDLTGMGAGFELQRSPPPQDDTHSLISEDGDETHSPVEYDYAESSKDAGKFEEPGDDNDSTEESTMKKLSHEPEPVILAEEAHTATIAHAKELPRSYSNSSLDSLASVRAASVFSVESGVSSVSSATTDPRYQEKIEHLLLDDAELNGLFQIAACEITFEKFENNFRRCLHLFSKHLRQEAPPHLPTPAPRLIHRVSRNVAHSIRGKFEIAASTGTVKDQQRTFSAPRNINDIDGDDNDEVDDLGDDVEEYDGPVPLEAVIIASTSFKMLRENFRLFLQSNPVLRAVFDCWPATVPWSESAELRFSGLHEVVHFIASRSMPLGQILTFTGPDHAVEAISCEDYLVREWPQIGRCLVTAVEKFYLTNNQTAVVTETVGDTAIQISNKAIQSGICMAVWAPYQAQGQIARALSWLCAVLRESPHQEISRSFVSAKAMNTRLVQEPKNHSQAEKTIQFKLDDLDRIQNPITCWHTVFPNNVVAAGFPSRPRVSGIGLEISFANLAYASRCLSFVAYNDGLICHGLKSVLIPMAEIGDDDAIQWHYENKTKQPSRQQASIGQILKLLAIGSWHKELDPSRLMHRRCFVGWVPEANIVLGTSEYLLTLGPSRVPLCPSTAKIRRYELTASVSAMSWVTFQGTHIREPVSISNSLSTSQQSDLFDILNAATDEQSIIYDNEQETAYCVPRASIVLQMAHSTVRRFNYELYEGDKPVLNNDCRFFAAICPEATSAAIAALKRCLRLIIRKPTENPVIKYKEENFCELIERIWHILSDIAENLESTASDFQLVGKSARSHLLGVDFLDAVNNTRPMAIRRVSIDQPWTHLTTEQPIVLLGRNILPPIVPACRTCASWSKAPPHQNLLVATGSTVNTLLDYRDNGLAQGLEWCISSRFMETHEEAGNQPICHVQKLRTSKKPLSNERLRAKLQPYLSGAFIFGNGKEQRCNAPLQLSLVSIEKDKGSAVASVRICSMSRFSSSASATSAEVMEVSDSRATSPSDQNNSTSGGSDLHSEKQKSTPGLTSLVAEEQIAQPSEAALCENLASLCIPNPEPEAEDIEIGLDEVPGSVRRSRFSSMFRRVRSNGIRSRPEGDKRRRRR